MARRALRAPNVPFTSSCQGRGTWVRGFSSGNETRLETDPRICPRPCEGVGLQCEPNCEETPDETGAARRFWDGMISSKPNLRMCQKFRLPDDCHHFMSKPHQTTVILVSLFCFHLVILVSLSKKATTSVSTLRNPAVRHRGDQPWHGAAVPFSNFSAASSHVEGPSWLKQTWPDTCVTCGWKMLASMGPSIHPAMDSYQMFYIVLYQSHPRHVSPSHTLDG